jgi:hypothetical protein
MKVPLVTSVLTEYWEHESFRSAARSLIALDESILESLRPVLPEIAVDDPSRVALEQATRLTGLDLQEAVYTLSALRAIFRLGRSSEGGISEVLQELSVRLEADGDSDSAQRLQDKRASLTALLTPTDESRRVELRRVLERAIIPAAERTDIAIDLRVLPQEDTFTLVPTILFRIELDEPYAGSAALTFQLSPQALMDMRSDIDETLNQLTSVSQGLTDWMH